MLRAQGILYSGIPRLIDEVCSVLNRPSVKQSQGIAMTTDWLYYDMIIIY